MKKKKTLKKKLKEATILNVILVVCVLLLASLQLYGSIEQYTKLSGEPDRLKIITSGQVINESVLEIEIINLTEDQEEKSVEIISQINPLYLQYHKKIFVVEESCDYHKKEFDENGTEIPCSLGGFNQNGFIFVNYYEDEDIFKEVICHELLHTYFRSTRSQDPNEDPLHAIIYALASKHVCFDKSGFLYGLNINQTVNFVTGQ